jgi:hypothetical protein
MRILLDTKKHLFLDIATWIYETMPKDVEEDRWQFVDSLDAVDSSGLLLQTTRTYIEFKNEKDAMLFTLRWS